MTPEQKQRIAHEISNWNNARNDHSAQITGDRMAALLQDLIDAPEPEPFVWWSDAEDVVFESLHNGKRLPFDQRDAYLSAVEISSAIPLYTAPPAPEPEPVAKVMHVDGLNYNNLLDCDLPTGTLLYTAPPAPSVPSVPDWLETTQFLTDVTTAAGLLAYGRRDKGLAQRIGDFAYKYRMLAAAPAAPKPPALSDERIFKLFLEKAVDKGTAGIYDFARAIEREILWRLGMTEAIDVAIEAQKGGES